MTAPSTAPWRSSAAVWSWSSVCRSSDRNAGTQQIGVGQADALERIALQQRGLLGQPHQHLALGGGFGGRGALDQQFAHTLFQRLDPLRHRRGGDLQRQRGALEAAFADHGGQSAELGVVDAHD